MQLSSHEIHIWVIHLSILADKEQYYKTLLSHEEYARAKQFHSPLHKKRFIIAHGGLRETLGFYLNQAPHQITFHHNHYKKPFVSENSLGLEFNMTHSDDLALYAITKNHALGVDIEKIKPIDNEGISKRYFSKKEKEAFLQLKKQEKCQVFYQLWSRKEALIKALGKGLAIPLSSFSVSIHHEIETIQLEDKVWTLLPLSIHPEYAAALVSERKIESISFWQNFDQDPCKIKTMKL